MKLCGICEAENGPRALTCVKCGATFGVNGGSAAHTIDVGLQEDGGMMILWPEKNEYLLFTPSETDAIARGLRKRARA